MKILTLVHINEQNFFIKSAEQDPEQITAESDALFAEFDI